MAFLQLFILTSVMFLSTLLLGSLPLTLSNALAPHRFHQLSIFSVGLLVGAALTIVIPEGVQAIYSSTAQCQDPSPASGSHAAAYDHHSAIGLALMGGFMLMFLIDQASTISRSKSRPPGSSTPLLKSAPSQSLQSRALLSEERWHEDGLPAANVPQSHTLSTTIGLLTHSLTDGIALGASSTHVAHQVGHHGTGRMSLNLIIFLAIMVHKAPAAFGLVAVLMAEGLPKALVRKILLAFSLAAPLSSLFTYAAFAAIHRIRFGSTEDDAGGDENASLQWWIGVTLLFSGGTFLFVATHALQDTASQPVDPCRPKGTNPTSTPSSSDDSRGPLTRSESSDSNDNNDNVHVGPLVSSALMVSGMMCPWLLAKIVGGHGHS